MDIDVVAPTRINRRHNLRRFFHAEESAFSAVRVEGRDGDTRLLNSPTLQFAVRQIDSAHNAIAFDESDRLCERHVCRQQHNAKITRDKSHRILFSPREMGEEFRVSGKTVAAEKKRSLINRRRGYRIDASRRTQLNRRLDVTSRSFARGGRLDSGFDKAGNVVEVVDDGFGVFRKGFFGSDYVV